MKSKIHALLAGTALATAALLPAASHAQQNQQDMQRRIEALERELQSLKGQVATQAETQKKAAEGGDYKVSTAGGLTIESKDGAFSAHLGGRILLDQAFYDEDKTRMGDGAEFRSLRLDVAGKMYYDFPYKVQVDFAGNATTIGDTYFGYDGWKPFEFLVGNYLPPISLDAVTSNKYTTFMEPALPQQVLQGRRTGGQATARGANWTVAGAVFSSIAADTAVLETDSGWAIGGRATYAPIFDQNKLLHFGIGVLDYGPNGETPVRIRARPESHVTGARFIDTGAAGIANADSLVTVQPEIAAVYGPVHAEAEYQWTSVKRGAGASDLDFWGWYAQAGWFITGEVRPYQLKDTPYSADFGRVKPLHPVGDGGLGAFEVGVRYSALDLSSQNVRGGAERDFTFGVNWYLNQFTRLMFNYVKVDNDNEALGNAAAANLLPGVTNGSDDDPSIYEMRAQIDF